MDNQTIRDYYDYTQPFYKLLWHSDSESNALHYGFWEKGTKSLKEALLNTNKFMAEKVNLNSKDRVLDAGCGIGGSSIWIAKNYGAEVVGITLNDKQVKKAKQLAKASKVDDLVQFFVGDFLDTTFKNGSFDVIWAIESVCHTTNKIDFLKEAYRLLGKGGRVIVSDGFLLKSIKTKEEQQIIDDFTTGFALPNLSDVKNFEGDMNKVGYKNVTFWNKTKEVLPSSKRMHKMSSLSYPVVKALEKLKLTSKILTSNNLAGIVQYKGLQIGLWRYGVFYGER